jgi:hypothetical protein
VASEELVGRFEDPVARARSDWSVVADRHAGIVTDRPIFLR